MKVETKALNVIEAKLIEAINECSAWEGSVDVSQAKTMQTVAYVANLITCCEYLRRTTTPYQKVHTNNVDDRGL